MSDNGKELALAEYGGFTRTQVDLLKSMVAKGSTDDELRMFAMVAKRTGLDPFARQIHFSKFKDGDGEARMTIITGIDGFRSTAAKTGDYAGSDDPVYEERKGGGTPLKATVTVWKIVRGNRVPFTASARWAEYYPGEKKGFKWRQMPYLMLGKCAEALALRKGFPLELSGLYTPEEMDQAGTGPEPEPLKQPQRTKAEEKGPEGVVIANVAAFKDRNTGEMLYSILAGDKEYHTELESIAKAAKGWKESKARVLVNSEMSNGKYWITEIEPLKQPA